MRQSSGKLNTKLLFLLIQTGLYIAFLLLDIIGKNSTSVKIKYIVILGCFLYALIPERKPVYDGRDKFSGKSRYKSTLFCLQAALFCTLVSDWFLLVLDYYLYGVIVFIIVQIFYCARLVLIKGEQKALLARAKDEAKVIYSKDLFPALAKRILLQLIITVAICFILKLAGVIPDLLLIATTFYFIGILSNVITATNVAVTNHRDKANVIYAIGMFLFLLCDINVGLFNLSGFIVIPGEMYPKLYSLSSILMWTFYAPAQVLIALSSKYFASNK